METLSEFASWLYDVAMWALFWYLVLKAIDLVLTFRKIKNDTDALKEHLEEELENILHTVKEEVHNDVRYWFDEDNDQFLAQGKDIDEVKAHLKQRFKDHIFVVDDRFVFAGPDYEGKDIGSGQAAIEYVSLLLLKRAGIQVVDK